ncbi:methyl-accepting chemotaxis protein [Methylobacterium sp. JK268]
MSTRRPWMIGLSLTTRISLIGIAVTALACAGALALMLADLRADMGRRAGEALDRNMRLLRLTLADEGGAATFSVVDGQLRVGTHVVDTAEPAVDRVREVLGGNATIFVGDTRLATNVVGADGKRATGTKLAQGPVRDAVLVRREAYRGEADVLGTPTFTAYEPILDPAGEVLGILYVGVRKADYLAALDATVWRAFGIGLILVLVGTGVLALGLRRAMRPLAGLAQTMRHIAEGQVDIPVAGTARRDEIGAMARAVEVFRVGLARTRELEQEAARARSDGEARRRLALREVAERFEAAVSGIVAGVTAGATQLRATSEGMADTATETASQSTTVAAAAEQAASNVATVAAAAEELGASVEEIGRQVSGSAELARCAVGEADEAAALVGALSEAAGRIGGIVEVIAGIAAQTNLLALNATIEAARAGEAGRGFAVVAAEVKELAGQTARATEEISGQVAGVQATTGRAVSAIGQIAGRIREIDAVTASIAAAVEEQGAATQEIVRNVAQAAAGTGEVTANIAGVARASEETGAAATQVLTSATDLSQQSAVLGREVEGFLQTVRAA